MQQGSGVVAAGCRAERVVLVGPMGAGKSTVGRRLAARLGWDFVDSDREVERQTGADIPLIFEKEGEAGFRRREREVLAGLLGRRHSVIATGGGAVLDEGTRARLSGPGTHVVYLTASVEQQYQRTSRDRRRPLLWDTDPRQRLSDLLQQREPLYRAVAHQIVSTDGRRPQAVAAEILTRLGHPRPAAA